MFYDGSLRVDNFSNSCFTNAEVAFLGFRELTSFTEEKVLLFKNVLLVACLEEGGREVGLDGILGCGVSWVFVMLCRRTEGAWGVRKGVLEGVWERGRGGESE